MQPSIPQKAQCFKKEPAGDSFLQRSGILISEAFVSGNSVKVKCFPYVWWLLSSNCLLLLSRWLTKDGLAVLPFSRGPNELEREEEEDAVSPSSTGNVNYPKKLLLILDCASLTV